VDILRLTGERIKGLVARRGYTSIELFAHENRIAKSTLSELLNGKNDPKLTTLAKICAGLEIPLSELFRDNGIDSWVREKAPDYDPRSPKSLKVKAGKGKAARRA
jgi:transcriptional regulator with XRE-family HTH domain